MTNEKVATPGATFSGEDSDLSPESSRPRELLTQLETWIASTAGQKYGCVRQYPNPRYAIDFDPECAGCLIEHAALELRRRAATEPCEQRLLPSRESTPVLVPREESLRDPLKGAWSQARFCDYKGPLVERDGKMVCPECGNS
jgi:hypothetical protein